MKENARLIFLQRAISGSGIGLRVSIYRMYGEGRSAGFELADGKSGEVLFTMDMDINRPMPSTRIYEVAGIRFCGAAPTQMLSDKVAAVSTDKVFRRIKDVIDLYYLSGIVSFDRSAVLDSLTDSGRALGDFDGFLHRSADLRHSYEKFRFAGDVRKPPFDEVYLTVKTYLADVLPAQ